MITKSRKILRVGNPRKYNRENNEFVTSSKLTYLENLYVYSMFNQDNVLKLLWDTSQSTTGAIQVALINESLIDKCQFDDRSGNERLF